jgi:hypothetical protein
MVTGTEELCTPEQMKDIYFSYKWENAEYLVENIARAFQGQPAVRSDTGDLRKFFTMEDVELFDWFVANPTLETMDMTSYSPAAHYATTGEEIWTATRGSVDIFVAGVGTGGTVSGAGRRLKDEARKKGRPLPVIVAVQPAESPVLTGGAAGPHKIQGIGAGFIPKNYDASVVDSVMDVTYEQAAGATRELGRLEGLLVGVSSGAAAWAALELARRPENKNKNIVVVLPDTGQRYLSTELFTTHV